MQVFVPEKLGLFFLQAGNKGDMNILNVQVDCQTQLLVAPSNVRTKLKTNFELHT